MKTKSNPGLCQALLIVSFTYLISFPLKISAQALGLNNSTPDNSAIMDAVSTSKGILIPRMTSQQRDSIASPATGLIVYVTDETIGFYFFNGTTWFPLFSPATRQLKRKAADESVCGTGGSCSQNTGTTLQNDDELVIPLMANERYQISGFLYLTATSSSPDCNIAFTVPSGATLSIGYHANFGDNNTNIGTDVLTSSGSSSEDILTSSSNRNPIFISGCVVMGSNPGNLTLQWSQANNSNSNTITIKENSFLEAELIR